MGAALKMETSGTRTPWRQWVDGLAEERPPQTPRNPVARREPAAKRDSAQHQLLTTADIKAAIAWCLEGIPASEVQILADALRPLAADFDADRPEVAAVLADLSFPGVRRRAWSIACAVLAGDAECRGDVALFWAAGTEVVKSLQQGLRGSHRNRKAGPASDALDALIAQRLVCCPGASTAAMWEYFTSCDGMGTVLVEYDMGRNELVCELDHPNGQVLTNVGQEEFARRVRRLRCRATGCM